jgi:hypothetical protein
MAARVNPIGSRFCFVKGKRCAKALLLCRWFSWMALSELLTIRTYPAWRR